MIWVVDKGCGSLAAFCGQKADLRPSDGGNSAPTKRRLQNHLDKSEEGKYDA